MEAYLRDRTLAAAGAVLVAEPSGAPALTSTDFLIVAWAPSRYLLM